MIKFNFISGPPDSPENCSVSNASIAVLRIQCLPGFNGGSAQKFHLEIYIKSYSDQPIHNLTSTEYPIFTVDTLPLQTNFLFHIYSTNTRGRSQTVILHGGNVSGGN